MTIQNWGTPPNFIEAFQKQFGAIKFDLAAEEHNAVHTAYYSKETDALTRDWGALYKKLGSTGWLWLNPPFGDMQAWVAKCIYESRQGHARIAMLHQNSLAQWFVDGVNQHAVTYLLSPRVKYVPPPGEEFYTDKNGERKKRNGADFDSALSLFAPETRGQIAGVWKWRSQT